MQLKGTRFFMALAVAAVLGSATSQAATLPPISSTTFGSSAPYDVDLYLDKFDSSLGTLTGVKITVSVQSDMNVTVVNLTNSDKNYSNVVATIPVTVSTTVGATATSSVDSATTAFGGTIAGPKFTDSTSSPVTGWATSSDINVASGDLGNYVGGGSQVAIHVNVGDVTASGTGAGVSYGADAYVRTYVTVTYEYDAIRAQPVPEPTSSAMFGIGIVLAVGLGWGRRRQLSNLAA